MFTRPEAETRTATSLGPLIDETVQLLGATLPSSIKIVWRRPAKPVVAVLDSSQLTQVLMNLGVNASHAFPDDRGRIEFVIDQVELRGIDATRLGVANGSFARIPASSAGLPRDARAGTGRVAPARRRHARVGGDRETTAAGWL